MQQQDRVQSFTWLFFILIALFTPFFILKQGYMPVDDALRHAAKPISGKEWTEIGTFVPEVKMDHNYGWDKFLTFAHKNLGFETQQDLLDLSIVALFWIFVFGGLLCFKSPIPWFLSLGLSYFVFNWSFPIRLFIGRPFLIFSTIIMLVLHLWTSQAFTFKKRLAATFFLMAASVFLHGSWYLLVVPAVPFFLLGRWKDAFSIIGCWIAGTLLGAVLTGHPIDFLWQHTFMMFRATSKVVTSLMLVGELKPRIPSGVAMLTIVGLIWFLTARGKKFQDIIKDPEFIFAIFFTLLGSKIGRFFLDMSLPVFCLWMGKQFAWLIEKEVELFSTVKAKALLAFVVGCFFFMYTTSDVGGKWSVDLLSKPLDAKTVGTSWLPEAGGICYTFQNPAFYRLFFHNPKGNWRYKATFEKGLLPDQDLKIVDNIFLSNLAFSSFVPWVRQMTPKDRLVLIAEAHPQFRGMEWKQVDKEFFIGRLKRK
jgi:hypothetical protein